MFNNKKSDTEEVTRLHIQLRDKDDQIRTLTSQLGVYKNLVKKAEDIEKDCVPVVDFAAMQAFAIERNKTKEGRDVTIIGYYNTNKESGLGEWYIYCSAKRHNELAQEFKRYVEARK